MGFRRQAACSRVETGKVFEQTIRATNEADEILILRRVTTVLDQPTRDGDSELQLLTNVPAKDAKAKTIAELYRRRWTIETAFPELEASLRGELNTLGYPKAALFGLLGEAAQASSQPEETEARKTERCRDQTCRHREDPERSSEVYKLTDPRAGSADPTIVR